MVQAQLPKWVFTKEVHALLGWFVPTFLSLPEALILLFIGQSCLVTSGQIVCTRVDSASTPHLVTTYFSLTTSYVDDMLVFSARVGAENWPFRCYLM